MISAQVLSHIKERFGPGNYRKQLSGFVQRILQVVEAPPEDPAIFAWLLLFAQLAGFHSRSSRLHVRSRWRHRVQPRCRLRFSTL